MSYLGYVHWKMMRLMLYLQGRLYLKYVLMPLIYCPISFKHVPGSYKTHNNLHFHIMHRPPSAMIKQ